MKKTTSLFLALILLLTNLLLGTVSAATVYSGYCGAEGDGTNIRWSFDSATGTLSFDGTGKMMDWRHETAYDSFEEDILDHEVIYTYTPWYSFRNKILHATFSDGITVMGNFVLGSCTNLKDVKLGKDLTNIGVGAFTECTSLTSVSVPSKVTSVGVGAFFNATSLSSVSLPEGLTTLYYGAFAMCSSLKNISLPSTLTQLNAGAFAMSGIQSIVLPEGITGISRYTFYSCESLTSIRFLGEIKYINQEAFSGCGLKVFKIPDTCTSIHQYAFSSSSFLSMVIHCYEGSYGETYCVENLRKGTYKVVNHDFVLDAKVAPTCTEKGYTQYFCDECDGYRKQDYVDALGHKMGAWSVSSVATSEQDGKLVCSCGNCGIDEYKSYPYHTPGDTDLDEELTVYDVILLLQQMAGIKEFDALALSAGDLNLNYAIDSEDATLLLQRVSGSDVYFPSEHPESFDPQ